RPGAGGHAPGRRRGVHHDVAGPGAPLMTRPLIVLSHPLPPCGLGQQVPPPPWAEDGKCGSRLTTDTCSWAVDSMTVPAGPSPLTGLAITERSARNWEECGAKIRSASAPRPLV